MTTITESIVIVRRVSVVDRLAVATAKGLLRWAALRAQAPVEREELARRVAVARDIQAREHAALRRAARS